jgi:hypothetical protein
LTPWFLFLLKMETGLILLFVVVLWVWIWSEENYRDDD